jgi:hypothetical protein
LLREVDYAAARPFWHPDIVIFGSGSVQADRLFTSSW